MRRRFHKANRCHFHLLPISIDQWVEDNHLARFLWDCVEQFNPGQFYAAYRDEGAPPCDPVMMLPMGPWRPITRLRISKRELRRCMRR